MLWRSAWADVTNKYLERMGTEARIDHRSHADRGILEQPTIHEGVAARAMEQQGMVADRCELNRQIKADNHLLRQLRKQMEKLVQALKNTIPAIAEAMKTLRRNMLVFQYQILHTKSRKRSVQKNITDVKPKLSRYANLVSQIKDLSRERKTLIAEKKALSVLNFSKNRELEQKIAQLTENIEELRSEKAILISQFDKADDEGMKEANKWVASLESSLRLLEQSESRYQGEMEAALDQFRELVQKTEPTDAAELHRLRQPLRKPMTQAARNMLQQTYEKKFSVLTMMDAERDVEALLRDEEKQLAPREKHPVKAPQKQAEKPQKRPKDRGAR